MINAQETETLKAGLKEIFKKAATTHGETAYGSEKIYVVVPQLNKALLLKVANLATNSPEEVVIKRSGEAVHVGFIPSKSK